MIKKYSIPIFKEIVDPEQYAISWFEDCLEKCGSDLKVSDYSLNIEDSLDGMKRATFLIKA